MLIHVLVDKKCFVRFSWHRPALLSKISPLWFKCNLILHSPRYNYSIQQKVQNTEVHLCRCRKPIGGGLTEYWPQIQYRVFAEIPKVNLLLRSLELGWQFQSVLSRARERDLLPLTGHVIPNLWQLCKETCLKSK